MRHPISADPGQAGVTGHGAPSEGVAFRQLNLAAQPAAARQARRFVRRVLHGWDLDELSGPAELAVSELVTNAVRACGRLRQAGRPGMTGEMITLTVRVTGTSLTAEVWDASPDPPVLREAGPTDDCGRGLLIVEFMARNWGYYAADGGKVVWCECG